MSDKYLMYSDISGSSIGVSLLWNNMSHGVGSNNLPIFSDGVDIHSRQAISIISIECLILRIV